MTCDLQNAIDNFKKSIEVSPIEASSSQSCDGQECGLKPLLLCQSIFFSKELTTSIGLADIRSKKWTLLSEDNLMRPVYCLYSHVLENEALTKNNDIEIVTKCFKDFVGKYSQYLSDEKNNKVQLDATEKLLKDHYQFNEDGVLSFPNVNIIVESYDILSNDLTAALHIISQIVSSVFSKPGRVRALRSQIGGQLNFAGIRPAITMSKSVGEFRRVVQPNDVNKRLKRDGSARHVSRWEIASNANIKSSLSSPELTTPLSDKNTSAAPAETTGYFSCTLQ